MYTKSFSCYSFVEFYLLDGIEYHLKNDRLLVPSERHFLRSVQYLADRLEDYKSRFDAAFALRLRDYLWFAAIGEARHSDRITGVYLDEMEDYLGGYRSEAYHLARRFHPTPHNIKMLYTLFNDYAWESGYGGDMWATIVNAVKLYDEIPHAAFIDHCADLKHNGGLAFDKPVPFWSDSGIGTIMSFLDFKFQTKSVVYDLPQFWSTDYIQCKVSYECIYLMNKLFAVTHRSPYYNSDYRYTSAGKRWDMSLTNQYSYPERSFKEFRHRRCESCGDYIGEYSWTDDNGDVYCEDCYSYCNDCYENFAGKTYENTYGDTVCEDCFDRYYFKCEKCGDICFYEDHDHADDSICNDCYGEDCEVCTQTVDACHTIMNLDAYDHSAYLSDTKESVCPACVKKFLDAGYRIWYTNNGLVMSKDIDKIMKYPYEELLDIELQYEFTYFSLIPQYLLQGGK